MKTEYYISYCNSRWSGNKENNQPSTYCNSRWSGNKENNQPSSPISMDCVYYYKLTNRPSVDYAWMATYLLYHLSFTRTEHPHKTSLVRWWKKETYCHGSLEIWCIFMPYLFLVLERRRIVRPSSWAWPWPAKLFRRTCVPGFLQQQLIWPDFSQFLDLFS
jgi:hypothetical protein